MKNYNLLNHDDFEVYKNEEYLKFYLKAFFITTAALVMGLICVTLAHSEQSFVNMDKVALIESSFDIGAYNENSHATGLYQITPIVIKDYNQFHERKYTLRDMYEPKKAYIVANWYMNSRIPSMLKHFHKQDTLENRLIAYNCGIKCVGKSLPLETKNYIKKYKSIK